MPFVKKTDSKDPRTPADARRIFIGRTNHLRFFVHEILEREDPGHNIISISGQGGVGKSTLLQRFLDEASATPFREYCLAALVNERYPTPASAMERLADQFRERGLPLKKFEEALTNYKEALRRMQATGYRDEREQLLREVTDTAGTIIEEIPLAGGLIHKGTTMLTEVVLEKGHMRQYLKDAARLEDPIGNLTTTFVKDLNQLADSFVVISGSGTKRRRRILLCIDTFEQLAPDIAPWLLDYVLEMEVSTNVVLIVAGRDSIGDSLPDDPKRWLPYLDSQTIHLLPLQTFTAEETRSYLEYRGIVDPERIKEITQLSQGLPLYLSMLTSNAEGHIDPNARVVENFLRWIPKHEVHKQQLALYASLFSLPFTQDDLAAFPAFEAERSSLYQWIIRQPFVQSNAQDGRRTYHDMARELFRRHLYQRSPEEYYTARKALSHFYQKRLETLQADGDKMTITSRSWQELALALLQQVFLLPDEASHLLGIEYAIRMNEYTTHKNELIRVLRSLSSYDPDQRKSAKAGTLVQDLLHYLEKAPTDNYQQSLYAARALLKRIAHVPSFPPPALASLYRQKGVIHMTIGEYEDALADFNQTLTLAPELAKVYNNRGETYRLMGRYEDALADFNQSIALNPNYAWTTGSRGQTYRLMGRYEDALADFDRAIVLDAKSAWIIGNRGQTYRLMGRYEDALADFDQSIALNPNYAWAIGRRGETYRLMGRFEDALADFNRAIALDAKSAWIIGNRGETYRLMGRYEDALADFDQSIALNPNYTWAIGSRGQTYRLMGRYEDALADFNRVIALDAKSAWIIGNRGETYRLMGRYEDALADFDQGIALDPNYALAIGSRGETYRLMGRYEDALADFDRAIALDAKSAWIIGSRGETYRLMGRYEDALADFDQGIALDPNYAWAIGKRGQTYRLMGRYEDALADFDRAIALDAKSTWIIGNRGETYLLMGRYEDALADFQYAVDHGHSEINSLGLVFSYLGKYEEAIECYQRSLGQDEYLVIAKYNIAVAMTRWKGLSFSLTQIDEAHTSLVSTLDASRNLYGLGGLEALAGNDKQALEYLQQAICVDKEVIDWARHDIAWLELRSNERFQALTSK